MVNLHSLWTFSKSVEKTLGEEIRFDMFVEIVRIMQMPEMVSLGPSLSNAKRNEKYIEGWCCMMRDFLEKRFLGEKLESMK